MNSKPAAQAERVYVRLVGDYQSAILNYLYRLVGDIAVAEDLTQETFLRAYRALGRLELEDHAEARRRGWLYRIAHNLATDHLRRRARLRWLPLEAARQQVGDDPADRLATREPVARALAALSEEQRQVLLLFSYAELSANEVAEVLGITPEAARKRRQRAREHFEAAYRAAADEE